MRKAFSEHAVVDFQSKEDFFDNPSVLVSRVRHTFDNKIRLNLDLEIQWEQVNETEQFVAGLKLHGIQLKRDSELRMRMAAELDDLLCRLFYNARSLLLRPLAPGQSGSGVLLATPFYDYGAGQPVIVKFGELEKIDTEYKNFKKFVQPFVGGGRSTSVNDIDRTAHLAGVVYSALCILLWALPATSWIVSALSMSWQILFNSEICLTVWSVKRAALGMPVPAI
jgi:hypothetical protein